MSYIESSLKKVYESSHSSARRQYKVIVHSLLCNENQTNDGIQNGGERVMKEVIAIMQETVENFLRVSINTNDITLSFLGNSLGGLYSRYAIARIYETLSQKSLNMSEQVMMLEQNIPVQFNIFCSIAAPHLGTASYTYIPLPSFVKIGLAHAIGRTGQDL